MSTIFKTATVTIALAGLLPALGGMGAGKGMPRYDKSSETTVAGIIQEVEYPDSPRGWQGVHLVLQAGEVTHAIHLGPKQYVEEQGFVFKTGDTIEIVGSRVKCQGEDALLARQITRGESTLKLRDGAGLPLWRGKFGGRRN